MERIHSILLSISAGIVFASVPNMSHGSAIGRAEATIVTNSPAPDGAGTEITELLWSNNRAHFERLGFRNSTELNNYLTIESIETQEDIKPFTTEEMQRTQELLLNSSSALTDVNATAVNKSGTSTTGLGQSLTNLLADLGDVNRWISVGKKIWEVIRNNQPVINVKTQSISVLPDIAPTWSQMETWRGPMAKSYTVQAKNLYGVTVISHTYTVAFHYGGSLNGRGQFLANATIIPTNINVAWGFSLNSQVNVGQPLNAGTRANPIPGVDLGLEWSMSSILKKNQGVDQFHVRGDGTSEHVNLY